MFLSLQVDDAHVCRFEIWEDRVPGIAYALRAAMPCETIIQHGKIVGDLLFSGVPVVAGEENSFRLQDICWDRREDTGSAAGALCFYSPRQQICMFYGDDLADEPFNISYIGETVGGADALMRAGHEIWSSPGKVARFYIDE